MAVMTIYMKENEWFVEGKAPVKRKMFGDQTRSNMRFGHETLISRVWWWRGETLSNKPSNTFPTAEFQKNFRINTLLFFDFV